MSSTKEFRDFVLEQLRRLDSIECKPMMGEYLLYCRGVLFGGIYDDRLLLKKTELNKGYALTEVIPYDRGKPMYFVENLEDVDYLSEVIMATVSGLI